MQPTYQSPEVPTADEVDDGEETLMRPRCGGRGYRREARVSIDRREARVSTGRREESDERMS